MLKNAGNWFKKVATGLSAILLLTFFPVSGLANKVHAAQKQQQAQQQHIRQVVHGIDIEKYFEEYRLQHEIKLLHNYLSLNKEFLERREKGLDTKEICIKRQSLEERVEKILNKQLGDMLIEMYPIQNKPYEHKLDVDITDVSPLIVITDKKGEILYDGSLIKAFSRNTLEKLEDLVEFLGPEAIKTSVGEFWKMSDEDVVKKIDELIAQAQKDKDGKLEREYRASVTYFGGYIFQNLNKVYISSRTSELSFITVICGHEYGHILHGGFPVSMNHKGEQETLQETICDLLGEETSSKYAQKYLRKDQKKYRKYTDEIMERKTKADMWKNLIKKADKLIAEGEIEKAELLMNETASKYGISEINQAGLAVAKLYYNSKDEEGNRDKLDYMLKELGPDYLVETTKYITNFDELEHAYRLVQDINKLDNNELKKSYLENQEVVKEVGEEKRITPFYAYIRRMLDKDFYVVPPKWEMRKEFVKESILSHELHERLSEKELNEIVKINKKIYKEEG